MNPLLVRVKREVEKWREYRASLQQELEEARGWDRARAKLRKWLQENPDVSSRILHVSWKNPISEASVLQEMNRYNNPPRAMIIHEAITQEYEKAINLIRYAALIDDIAEQAIVGQGPTAEQLRQLNQMLSSHGHKGLPDLESNILDLLKHVDSYLK